MLPNIFNVLAGLIFFLVSYAPPRTYQPIVNLISACFAVQAIAAHPRSKSKRQLALEAEQEKMLASVALAATKQQAIVQQQAEEAAKSLLEKETQLRSLQESLQQYHQSLQQERAQLEQQYHQHQSLVAATLNENYQLKQPDLVNPVDYEDLIANEIIRQLYSIGIIVADPHLRPFTGGFELKFSIKRTLPKLISETKEEVQSLATACRTIEKYLPDIQGAIPRSTKKPDIDTISAKRLQLTVWLNKPTRDNSAAIQESDRQPEKFVAAAIGSPGVIGNEIIDHCFANGIILNAVDCHEYSNSEMMFWFKPDVKNIARVQRAIASFNSQFHTKARLSVDPDGEEYISVFWSSSEKVTAIAEDGTSIEIVEPEDPNWFVKLILDPKANHFLIHGSTGTGKSVLVDNVISVAGYHLSLDTGKRVKIAIIDPKYPQTDWVIRGKRVRPDYVNWEEAVEGVADMYSEVDERLRADQEAADKAPRHLFEDPKYKLPLIDKDIIFYIVDEAAQLHETDKSVAVGFKHVSRVGRSGLVRAILIGQNYNCSNYGLQIPDLNNFVRIYLGAAMAIDAIDKIIKPAPELKKSLKKQIYARERLVKQRKMEGVKNPVEQYFCLVWLEGVPPFVAQLPAPQAYAELSLETIPSVTRTKPDSTLDLVEEAMADSEQASQLEKILEKNSPLFLENLQEDLPEHLATVLKYARRLNKPITAREFKNCHRSYREITKQIIEGWFQELVERDAGTIISSDKTKRFLVLGGVGGSEEEG